MAAPVLTVDRSSSAGPADAPAPARPHRWHVLLLGGALPLVLIGLARTGTFAEGDTFWAARAGAEILRARTIFLTETDSWSAAGVAWHPNSWLYDVVIHLVVAGGGRLGLGLFALLTIAGVGVATARVGRALGARVGVLTVVGLAANLAAIPWYSARPQTVSYALLLLVVLAVARMLTADEGPSPLRLLGLYLLTALWVNVHLAALSGLIAVGGGLAVVLLTARSRALLGRGTAALAAIGLGLLSSPLGTDVFSSALATRDASVADIPEWAPLWRAGPLLVPTWCAGLICLAVLVLARRQGNRAAWLPFWTGAVGVLLIGGISAARFSPMAVVVAVPAVAAVVGGMQVPGVLRRITVALAVAVLIAVGWVAVTNLPSFGEPGPLFPTAATIAAIPDGCRVLNEYDEGGLVTLLRRDDGVLVARDGRNDVYGVDVLDDVEALAQGRDGALAELASADVRCLLLDPDRPLLDQARAAGWRTAATDDARVLLVAP